MSFLPAVPNLRLVLKNKYFVTPALLDHVSDNLSPIYRRPAQGDLFTVRDEVHLIQLDGFATGRKLLNVDCLTGGDFVLLAPGFNYSVNRRPPKIAYFEILPTHAHTVKLLHSVPTVHTGRGVQLNAPTSPSKIITRLPC